MRDSRDISRPVWLNECFRLTTLVSAVPPESVGAAMALQAPHGFTEFIPTGWEGEAAPQRTLWKDRQVLLCLSS